jgi:2'-5' RNA ligase
MRLFIAIDLPESVKDYLRTVQANLPAGKMSKTHDFHLTLKFLGSCEENRRKRVEESLRDIPFQPFEAALTEIGVFGGNKPRVVWVGINVPEWLAESVREIENRMAKLGFKKEYGFMPHVTLARVKFVEDFKVFLDALKKIKIEPHQFSVKHFYLFESKLSPKGAVHQKLAEFP